MSIRAAINGYGRIGRCLLRAACERGLGGTLDIVAINELANLDTMAYLTRYDTTHGRFPGTVEVYPRGLLIDGRAIAVSGIEAVELLEWNAAGIDLVFECSGSFSSRAHAQAHIERGARRVLFSQPAGADIDATVVYGINHHGLGAAQTVISAASCSTNCIVPVIDVLDRALGVDSGVITTIHSAMNDQPVLDAYHHTDLRKTRAALQSIIPVDTGLAAGIGRILPRLAGRFEAQAMRVPTLNVSAIDLSVVVRRDTTGAEVNTILREAAQGALAGILGYTEEPLASCDFNHDPRSGIVDASQTRVGGRRLLKVLTWFDNEWGYANRMLDVALYWAAKS
ncbi:MAG: erythrose-4-phosphate dehydrogenase [Gammaproteobacteria bacterium]|nr:erythrose-4-phosphate dehydrogenase [Gammaproteobacteria bacterium]